MSWTIDVRRRSGSRVIVPADLSVTVQMCRWAALGGPTAAEVAISGRREQLMALFDWLGCRIRIFNEFGSLVWWGQVDDIEVGLGSISVAAGLGMVANRVMAFYSYDTANGRVDGQTDWSEDAESVARFGRCEKILSLNDTTVEGAEKAIARELERYGRPRIAPSFDEGTGARLTCVGIFSTLERQYWQQLAGREVHSEDVGNVQNAVGWKMGPKTGIILGGKAGDRIGDIDAGFTGLPADQRIVVEGSDSNNIGFVTAAEAEVASQVVQVMTTIVFDSDDDVSLPDGGDDDWAAFTEGNPILFEGDTPMDGVLTFLRTKSTIWYMLVHPKLVVNDPSADNITVTQGNAVEVSPAPVLEYDGNTITITADGIKIAQEFTLEHDTDDWPLHEVWVHLARVGAPTDDVVVEICADNSGQPGTVLVSTSVDGDSIPTTAAWVEFGMGGTLELAYGTTYWLQVRRSGSSTTGDFFVVTLNDASIYARGDLKMTGAAGTYNARLQGNASMNFELWGHLPNVTQLANILGDHDLVAGVDTSQVTAEVWSRQYREGDQSARDEVETLLQWTSERWLLVIDADERAVIYPAPAETAPVGVLGMDGRVRRRYGGAFEPGRSLAGEWVLLDDLPGYESDSVGVGVQFVEACEWDVAAGAMRLEFSDRRAWVIDGIVQG